MNKYANILTQERTDELPRRVLLSDGAVVHNADWAALRKVGWRRIASVEEPERGYRALRYLAEDVDGDTARLVVQAMVLIADEEAAQAARVEAEIAAREKQAAIEAAPDALAALEKRVAALEAAAGIGEKVER